MVRLNAFPSEVLANILDYAAHPEPTILKLWQCGDMTLNYKLQYGGCQTVKLAGKQYTTKKITMPRLIFNNVFYALRTLNVTSYQFLPLHALQSIGPSLCNLTVKCPNLDKVLKNVDYATQWPLLESLTIIQIRSTLTTSTLSSQYLPHLPSTLTQLTFPKLQDTSILDFLNVLPRELRQLSYAHQYHGALHHILQAVTEQEFLNALPPNIQQLRIGSPFVWSLQSNTNMSLIPSQLRTLCITYSASDPPVILPQALQTLKIQMRDIIDANSTLSIPKSVTDLSFMSGVYQSSNVAIASFTPTQWVQYLPSQLVRFACAIFLPLQWDALHRDQCIWPGTLRNIKLHVTDSHHFTRLSLQHGMKNVELAVYELDNTDNPSIDFAGMLTATHHTQLVSLMVNFTLSNKVIAELPKSLTHLASSFTTITPFDAIQDYQPLSLQQLQLSGNSLCKPLRLPDSLTDLSSGQFGLIRNASLDQTLRLFQSLPSKLRRIDVSKLTLDLMPEYMMRLPQTLIHLEMRVNLDKTPLDRIIAHLPRTLQILRLRVANARQTEKDLSGSATWFASLLPPHLKQLYIRGYTFNEFDFSQPISSLELVCIEIRDRHALTAEYGRLSKLFPNAVLSI